VAWSLKKQKPFMPEAPALTAENARKNLYCAVLNTNENALMLETVPHEKLIDLSVVARFKAGTTGSFLVTNEICKSLHMTSEEVLEAAHHNTNQQIYKLQTMTDVVKEIMCEEESIPEDYVDELIGMQGDECPMWILSNESRVDGAAAITSPDALKAAHDKLGEDFYILPSSRHELILIPKSCAPDVDDLKEMVREVNATQVSRVDKLSDSVYQFDGRKLSLSDASVEKTLDVVVPAKVHAHCH
jgi:hypothetical protein